LISPDFRWIIPEYIAIGELEVLSLVDGTTQITQTIPTSFQPASMPTLFQGWSSDSKYMLFDGVDFPIVHRKDRTVIGEITPENQIFFKSIEYSELIAEHEYNWWQQTWSIDGTEIMLYTQEIIYVFNLRGNLKEKIDTKEIPGFGVIKGLFPTETGFFILEAKSLDRNGIVDHIQNLFHMTRKTGKVGNKLTVINHQMWVYGIHGSELLVGIADTNMDPRKQSGWYSLLLVDKDSMKVRKKVMTLTDLVFPVYSSRDGKWVGIQAGDLKHYGLWIYSWEDAEIQFAGKNNYFLGWNPEISAFITASGVSRYFDLTAYKVLD
jgi:hypothetical protein